MFRLKATRGELIVTSHERNLREEIKVGGSASTYVTQVVLISSWMVYEIHFKQIWRKKSKTNSLEWILCERVTKNILKSTTSIDHKKKKLSKKLGLNHSNPVRSPTSAISLLVPDREARTPSEEHDYLSVIGSLLLIVNYTRPNVQSSWTQLSSKSCEKGSIIFITLGTTLLLTTGNVRIYVGKWTYSLGS